MAVLTVLKPGTNANGFVNIGGAQSPAGGGDEFPNDGKTILRFTNTNAATRTATIAPFTAATLPGVWKTWSLVVPATNGDIVTRAFEPGIYNNASGNVPMTYDAVTNLSVYCISCSTT
jgi:hypothetical protein